MKKLLQILAASLMVVPTPIYAVSCKTKEKDVKQYDYNQALNNFIGEVTAIFKTAMFEAFLPYAWIAEDDPLLEGFTIQELLDNEEHLQDKNSFYYRKVSAGIYNIIPTEKINQKLAQEVSNNINYNLVTMDSSTPLKNGIDIKSIELYKKDKNLSLAIRLTSLITYKEITGEKGLQEIETTATMNIFAAKSLADKAKDISEGYDKLINETLANKYSFISNKGEQGAIADKISSSAELKSDLTQELVIFATSNSNIQKINTNELSLVVNSSTVENASRYKTEARIAQFEERNLTLNKAMIYNGEDKDKFLRNASDDDTGDWIRPVIDNVAEKSFLDEKIKKDSGISRSINQYNLENNIADNRVIQTLLSTYKSKFEIKDDEDKLTIASYGAELKNLSFVMEGQTYDFSERVLFIRQKTSYSSTRSYYEKFISDSFDYQQKFYHMEDVEFKESPDEQRHLIILPRSWKKGLKSNKWNWFIPGGEQMLFDLQGANEFLEELGLFSKFEMIDTGEFPSYLQHTDKNTTIERRAHFGDTNWGKPTNRVELKTYLFSYNGAVDRTTNFYTNKNDDLNMVIALEKGSKTMKSAIYYPSYFIIEYTD
ncbi:hypothetical protein [Spiroplasma endosymbiont of Panorpa germanica]|uniref:hypothetical protein n=1 Tax=Spiroplasma endosymbiont of Panorpa germanica TaxID=3066314 RepID=UPI0030D2F668